VAWGQDLENGWLAGFCIRGKILVPKYVGNFLNSSETASFSRRTLLHGVSK
jgi:hypothetical protein